MKYVFLFCFFSVILFSQNQRKDEKNIKKNEKAIRDSEKFNKLESIDKSRKMHLKTGKDILKDSIDEGDIIQDPNYRVIKKGNKYRSVHKDSLKNFPQKKRLMNKSKADSLRNLAEKKHQEISELENKLETAKEKIKKDKKLSKIQKEEKEKLIKQLETDLKKMKRFLKDKESDL